METYGYSHATGFEDVIATDCKAYAEIEEYSNGVYVSAYAVSTPDIPQLRPVPKGDYPDHCYVKFSYDPVSNWLWAGYSTCEINIKEHYQNGDADKCYIVDEKARPTEVPCQ
ncbi:MAG: hypothetical protein LBB59_00730 [Campylobacteraceae bacterium]|jgi:hypothetical protein|nr:hypothetical protein [Campylobacteraceae bacterium]